MLINEQEVSNISLGRKPEKKLKKLLLPNKIRTHKRVKRTLVMTQTHNLQITAVSPFVKLQNDTQTAV